MFSIVLPIYDPFDRLVAANAIQPCLQKVLEMQGEFELILVNNNPGSACPQIAQYLRYFVQTNAHQYKLRLIEPNTNLGTARGFNAGFKAAQQDSDYLVYMSQDADIVDHRMLERIQSFLSKDPLIGIAHPTSVYEDCDAYNFDSRYDHKAFIKMIHKQYSLDRAEMTSQETEQILKTVNTRTKTRSSRNFPLTFAVITRKLITSVGVFDEGIAFGCHETDDLSYRTLLAGFKIVRLDGVFVNHRRYLFRDLCVRGTSEASRMPHADALKQSTDWWYKKWGKSYLELYLEWRYGAWARIMQPILRVRRVAGSLRWNLYKAVWRSAQR